MYLEHFGYQQRPFDIQPDSSYYFPSRLHGVGLSVLEYALFNDAPFCILTGRVGSGKSTLIEMLLKRKGDQHRIFVVRNTHSMFGNVLALICQAIEIEVPESQQFSRLRDLFEDLHMEGYRPVLVIDEAQNLTLQDLEAVRLFTNLTNNGRPLVQILLVGQAELLERLRGPEMRQLVQRVSANFNLEELSEDAVVEYVMHRERIAGASESRFTKAALTMIAKASGGIPRVVNAVCDMALVYAFSDGVNEVGVAQVSEVVREKLDAGLYWSGAENTEDALAAVGESIC